MKKMNSGSAYAVVVVCSLLLGWHVNSWAGIKSAISSSLTGSAASSATGTSLPNAASRPTFTSAPGKAVSVVTATHHKNHPVVASAGTATTDVMPLSPYAEEIARILKFDRHVLRHIKEISHERIGRLIGFDSDGYQIIAQGVVVSVPEERTEQILAALRHKLVPLHYLPFVVDINAGIRTDKIGIIRGTDQFEILRIMHTDGEDYGITNQDVIERLQAWERCWPFDIVGADDDWVELEFKKLPGNLRAFAEEVYAFCPDAVNQGPGSVDGLVKELERTKHLNLWWDSSGGSAQDMLPGK